MKIVIHGTKGGYHTFNTERIPGLIDARPDFNKVAAIGQEAYAINFNPDKVIFSKYKIIRDVIGEKRIGHIASSILMPNNEKLSGADIKDLLDKLSEEYNSKYVTDDNLDNAHEDWTFVNELTKIYESRLRHTPEDTEAMQPGQSEAAFAYYSSEEQLQNYFESPYQDEYKPFKQIFFVKSDLEGKAENPLNALRHSSSNNLTGQIDLKNPQYRLLFNENARGGIKIEIRVNGSKSRNNTHIRKKNELEILYTKPFYDSIKKTGRWYDIDPQYLIVDDNAQTITIRETQLLPETKAINFEVRDRKSNQIDDAEITCRNNRTKDEKKIANGAATFEAEELHDQWTASSLIGNRSGKKEFIPIDAPADVVLILEERKIVTFTVKANEELLFGYKIQIQGKTANSNDPNIEFIGDEISKIWTITISRNDYETKTFSYCPATDENPKYITLSKKQSSGKKQNFKVDAGDHGTLHGGHEYWSLKEDGSDVKDMIVPNKGYIFDTFSLNNNILKAYYKKKETVL